MQNKHIEHLLNKYFNGESSLEEEKMLHDFFEHEDVPEQLADLKPLFTHSAKIRHNKLNGPAFDTRITSLISKLNKQEKKTNRKRIMISVSGIAAAIIFSVFSIVRFSNIEKPASNAEAELAYEQISTALRFMVTQLDKGLDPMKESGSEINKAIQPTKKLGKLDQTLQKMITIPLDNEQ